MMSERKSFESGTFTAADPVVIPLKRELLVAGIPLAAFEILVAVWPLWTLLNIENMPRRQVAMVAIPVYIAALGLWLLTYSRWLRPLAKLVYERREYGAATDETLLAASRMMARIPMYMILARTFLWTAGAIVAGVVWKVTGMVDSWYWVQDLIAVGVLHGYIVACVRGVITAALIRRVRARLFPDEDMNVRLVEGYQYRFRLVGASVIGGYVAGFATFIFFFVPVTTSQYTKICAFLALCVYSVGWLRTRLTNRVTRRLDLFLQQQNRVDTERAITPSEAHLLAQNIPYRLAFVHSALLIIVVIALSTYVRNVLILAVDPTIVVIAVGFILVLGAFIYESLAHRQKTAPVISYLTAKYRFPITGSNSALSLGTKLMIAVGGVVLFSCLLALIWGIVQYRNLSADFVSKQSDLGLQVTSLAIQREVAHSPTPPGDDLVIRVLEDLETRPAPASYIYLGEDRRVWKFGSTFGDLPWYYLLALPVYESGELVIPRADLSGRYQRMRVTWNGREYVLGSVAVLYPNYATGETSARGPLRELVIFFLILFGACAGIAILAVMQFSAPIRQLEEQANRLAGGNLTEPVRSGAEADEIGRLTYAMEDMRQALADKLRTSEEQAAELERAVAERTSDLANKNKELAEALASLTTARSQLVQSEKLASIGQLVAGIAHEINNPVNAIVNTIAPLAETIEELSEEGKGDSEAKDDAHQMLAVMQRGAQRTKAIVSALHNYSRTDDQNLVPFDLNRAIDDTLELLRHSLKTKVKVVTNYDEVGKVTAHAGQINQVFMNLITNAQQAMGEADGASLWITTKDEGDKVIVSIRDNGPGMAATVQAKIFDPFFTTKDVGQGTGLGLSIVHSIVEAHGGTITVESEVGAGTTFHVTLPKRGRAETAR